MEHKITQFSVLTDPARPMPSIAVLQCREPAPLDAAPVDYLVAQRGADAAEEMICRVLEDIALRLDAVQQAMAAQGFTMKVAHDPRFCRPDQRRHTDPYH